MTRMLDFKWCNSKVSAKGPSWEKFLLDFSGPEYAEKISIKDEEEKQTPSFIISNF